MRAVLGSALRGLEGAAHLHRHELVVQQGVRLQVLGRGLPQENQVQEEACAED